MILSCRSLRFPGVSATTIIVFAETGCQNVLDCSATIFRASRGVTSFNSTLRRCALNSGSNSTLMPASLPTILYATSAFSDRRSVIGEFEANCSSTGPAACSAIFTSGDSSRVAGAASLLVSCFLSNSVTCRISCCAITLVASIAAAF